MRVRRREGGRSTCEFYCLGRQRYTTVDKGPPETVGKGPPETVDKGPPVTVPCVSSALRVQIILLCTSSSTDAVQHYFRLISLLCPPPPQGTRRGPSFPYEQVSSTSSTHVFRSGHIQGSGVTNRESGEDWGRRCCTCAAQLIRCHSRWEMTISETCLTWVSR